MTGDRNPTRLQPAFALWVAAALLAATTVLPVIRGRGFAPLATGALACAIGIGLTWWAARQGQRSAATALLASTGLWAGLTGWLSTLLLDRIPVVAVASAAVCAVAVTALASRLAAGVGRVLVTAVAVVTVATAVAAGGITAGADVGQPARLAPVVVLLSLGLLARHSLAAGGLTQATFRLRTATEPAERSERQLTVAEEYLRGGLVGLATVAGAGAATLLATGNVTDVALGVGTALLLWTRSRLFERIAHVLPLRVAALSALLAGAARILAAAPTWGLAVGLLVLGVVTVCAARSDGWLVHRGRWLRAGELALAGTVAVTLPIAVGLFDFEPTIGAAG
ncbi:hypothetical protein [Micromonospora polyrhachis]|uniref:EccD-like transmembrane domain-containing protein n=1 Tax=Micromonospora polyrhachis TaxID=1282883 RepID=A0A7W7SX58_9ACTN|nr:hypothetical protein [Micromonospora polyrhachis]MBB4962589.1 hypothetical protein [Micromonospora polyrhachis]